MNPTLEMTIEPGDREWFLSELADAWRAAHGEATLAYQHWREQPGPNGYAVYRAAQDRADQAQEVLAKAARAPIAGHHTRRAAGN